MRALQARLVLSKQRGSLTPEEELAVQSPLRKFKSMFPNTPLAKHAPLDVLLTAPSPQPRTLIVRDLGSVQNDWLATEFVLAYFEGSGISPPVSLYPCYQWRRGSFFSEAEENGGREAGGFRTMRWCSSAIAPTYMRSADDAAMSVAWRPDISIDSCIAVGDGIRFPSARCKRRIRRVIVSGRSERETRRTARGRVFLHHVYRAHLSATVTGSEQRSPSIAAERTLSSQFGRSCCLPRSSGYTH